MENGELYIPDCLFPTDNPLEIPCLLSDVQPLYIEIPFYSLVSRQEQRT